MFLNSSNRVHFSNNSFDGNQVLSGDMINTMTEYVISDANLDEINYPLIIADNNFSSNTIYGSILKAENIANCTGNEIIACQVYNADLVDIKTIKGFSNNMFNNNSTYYSGFDNDTLQVDSLGFSLIKLDLVNNDEILELQINQINNISFQGYLVKMDGGDFNLINNYISGNTSTIPIDNNMLSHGEGSALWLNTDGGTVVLQDNTLINNSGHLRGAGVYVNIIDSLYIDDNIFSMNQLQGEESRGGALYINNGNCIINNNTFSLNRSKYGSAVVFEENAIVSIEANTINNNFGEYAVWGNPVSLTQNNLYSNIDEINNEINNFRYTGIDSSVYIYNFWGTRSDQGEIDPSIYDDDENPLPFVIYSTDSLKLDIIAKVNILIDSTITSSGEN